MKGGCTMYLIRKFLTKVVHISNLAIFIVSLLLIVSTAWLIMLVERETFPTFFDGLWWVMTTVTTVGYGDFYPVSIGGRLIGVFLYLFGIALIGLVLGKIIEAFAIYRKRREEGEIMYKGKNHYIIIGWSQKAKYAIREMINTDKNIEIIIIDELEKAPILDHNIHYIQGNASERNVLEKANIKEANTVLVFADDKIENGQLTDGKTLLIASTIESIAPEVYTIVEIMEEIHMKNFKYMNVDEFILSHETISSLFVRSAFRKGISNIFSQLLKHAEGDDLYYIPTHSKWKTYRDAFDALLEKGATLVADRDQLNINRMLDHTIPKDAELYVICDSESHQRILEEV